MENSGGKTILRLFDDPTIRGADTFKMRPGAILHPVDSLGRVLRKVPE